jgi:hypothetical protein
LAATPRPSMLRIRAAHCASAICRSDRRSSASGPCAATGTSWLEAARRSRPPAFPAHRRRLARTTRAGSALVTRSTEPPTN